MAPESDPQDGQALDRDPYADRRPPYSEDAEQAVLAEPHNVVYRVTLAEIYLDAGLMARAAGEAARALALAPTDSRARALSKRVAKGK